MKDEILFLFPFVLIFMHVVCGQGILPSVSSSISYLRSSQNRGYRFLLRTHYSLFMGKYQFVTKNLSSIFYFFLLFCAKDDDDDD